jgi:hypothetical protein
MVLVGERLARVGRYLETRERGPGLMKLRWNDVLDVRAEVKMDLYAGPRGLENSPDVNRRLIGYERILGTTCSRCFHPVDFHQHVLAVRVTTIGRKRLDETVVLEAVHLPAVEQAIAVGVRMIPARTQLQLTPVTQTVAIRVGSFLVDCGAERRDKRC